MTVRELIEDNGYEDVVIFDNPSFEGALLGISEDNRAVYDYEKMVESLVNTDGMSWEEAAEFIDYNTIRSLPYTAGAPIVVYRLID